MKICVPDNLLRPQLLLAGALACAGACDPVQYPEGFTYILDTDAGPKVASGALDIVTASSDNVSLYGHVAFFDRALTPVEVSALYQRSGVVCTR